MLRLPSRYHAQSLRWRLLRLVTVATVLVWILAAVLSYLQAERELRELLDAQMDKSARMLLAQAQFSEPHLADLLTNMAALRGARVHRDELPIEFQIGRDDGTLLVRSVRAPKLPLSGAPGFSNIVGGKQSWRSLIMTTASGDFRIQVLQSLRQRDRQVLEMAGQAVIPLGVLFPLLIALIYFSVRRGLEPLDNLAGDVATRSLENLAQVSGHAVPLEARSLVDALNDLLQRLTTALEHERHFIADAAHELRTPLAVVKVQAQVALGSKDAIDQRHALHQVVAGTDRATRLVEQLLGMARLDPMARLSAPQRVDLAELARRLVAQLLEANPSATSRINLDVGDEPMLVSADAELLGVALRNLLDNALRYAPADSPITVYARREDGALILGVMDEGDGVPADELPQLAERFYRGRNVRAGGSGLGLSIVARIAELHAARLEIRNREGGGLDARLHWLATLDGHE